MREFEGLGIIAVRVNTHAANTYILLGEMLADALNTQPDAPLSPLAATTMPLADKPGLSKALRPARGSTHATAAATPLHEGVVTAASPDGSRGGMVATPDGGRGSTGDSQVITRESNKPEEQPTTGGGGGEGVGDLLVAGVDTGRQITTSVSYGDAAPVVNALCRLGIRRATAEELAAQHPLDHIEGWVRYAHETSGLKNPAGFVLSRLKAGDVPPDPADRFAGYAAPLSCSGPAPEPAVPTSTPQPEVVHDLLTRYDVDAPLLNLWLDVRDQLLQDEPAAYQVLRDCFLAPASSGSARVILPPTVPVADALPHADAVQAALRACGAGELDVQFEPVSQVEVGTASLDCQPPTDWMQSVWRAAAPDLQKLVGAECWRSWLAQVRLIGHDGATWLLRLPPGNIAAMLAERWDEQVTAVLAGIYGRAVRLHFSHRPRA